MKIVLRILAVVFFILGLAGFREITGILTAIADKQYGFACGFIFGSIVLWWIIACFLWFFSNKIKR